LRKINPDLSSSENLVNLILEAAKYVYSPHKVLKLITAIAKNPLWIPRLLRGLKNVSKRQYKKVKMKVKEYKKNS
jgi:hypothetical protein